MQYYIAKTVSGTFPATVERVIASLKAEGFGVLTEIDVKATMKKKLDLDFREYRILGACNPPLAHQALTADDKIGTMLPCNVIVQDIGGGRIEVAAINPAISMQHVGNPTLQTIADSVTGKLKPAIPAMQQLRQSTAHLHCAHVAYLSGQTRVRLECPLCPPKADIRPTIAFSIKLKEAANGGGLSY